MPRIKANGLEFEYDERGPKDGEPLVLVMGYTAQMTNWPEGFCDSLADAGYRVIRFDNRDIGLSSQLDDKGMPDMGAIMQKTMAGEDPGDLAPYTLNDMAADTAAVIEALDAKPAHIMGASMGGMIVQLVALNHPEHVRSVIPIMTTSGDPSLPQATPEAMAVLLEQPASTARDDVVKQGVKAQRVIGSHESVRNSDDELAERVGNSFDRAYRPMGVMRQYAAILSTPRWHDQLGEIGAPVHVIHGEVDPLIPPAGGQDIANRIPHATISIVEKWGHDLPTAMIPELTGIITGFLERTKAPATT